jgi:hypothetical protein
VVEAPVTVWFAPSPKFHTTLLIEAEDELGITVNVSGEPAVPTLVEVATEIDRLVGLLVR